MTQLAIGQAAQRLALQTRRTRVGREASPAPCLLRAPLGRGAVQAGRVIGRIVPYAAAEDEKTDAREKGLTEADIAAFVRSTGGASLPVNDDGNPDFDAMRIDDAYYEEMGIPEDELLEQRSWAADDADPDGYDINLADSAGASVREDAPQYLIDDLADEPEPWGPPRLLLAGFHVEEAAFVRMMLDSAGGSAVSVVEVTPEALYGTVADAVAVPELDWTQPRPPTAPSAGGGWGAQRTILFSGLRTVDVATALELLSESGLADVCAAVVTEDDASKVVGEVLARAVKETRGRVGKNAGGRDMDSVKASGRMSEKLPPVEEVVGEEAMRELAKLEGDDEAVQALFEATDADFEMSIDDIKAAAAARRAAKAAAAGAPEKAADTKAEAAARASVQDAVDPVLDQEEDRHGEVADAQPSPSGDGDDAIVAAEFTDADPNGEWAAHLQQGNTAPDLDLDALVDGADLPEDIAAAVAQREASVKAKEDARERQQAEAGSQDAQLPKGNLKTGGFFASEEDMRREVEAAVQAALKGPDASRNPEAAARLEAELEAAESQGFNKMDVIHASNTMEALEAAMEAGLEPEVLKEFIDAVAAERKGGKEKKQEKPKLAYGPADYNGEHPEPIQAERNTPAVVDTPSQLSPLNDARYEFGKRTHYIEREREASEGDVPATSSVLPAFESENGEVQGASAFPSGTVDLFGEAARAVMQDAEQNQGQEEEALTFEEDAQRQLAMLAAAEAPWEMEQEEVEAAAAQPVGETMSRTQLEETAKRHGLDLEALLADIEARGITLSD